MSLFAQLLASLAARILYGIRLVFKGDNMSTHNGSNASGFYPIDDGYTEADVGKVVTFCHPERKFRIVCKCRNGPKCAAPTKPYTVGFFWDTVYGLPDRYRAP